MNSFKTIKIPEWVRTLQKKHKINDDEFWAVYNAYEEVQYLYSLNMSGDNKHDRDIEALKKKAKSLEKFGEANYRWPKSIATIRYELRAVMSNNEAFSDAMDLLLAMKNVPRDSDYGMIKARKNDEENRKMLHYNGSDETND